MKINFGWPGKLTQPMRFTTLKGFDRFRVSHKIGLGYAIVLGIAIGGTTTGVWVGNHYTQKAQNYEADCRAEIKLLTRLQTHVLKARNHHSNDLDGISAVAAPISPAANGSQSSSSSVSH
jgi:hypothetical protein